MTNVDLTDIRQFVFSWLPSALRGNISELACVLAGPFHGIHQRYLDYKREKTYLPWLLNYNWSVKSMEEMLNNYFEKANITPDNTYLTFRKDGTFERCVAGHKAEGLWMLGDKLLLGIHNVQTAAVTQHLEDGELTLVLPAGRIMSAMVSLGAIHDTATNNALVKLSKKLKGIEGGFTMVKKQ